MAPSASRALPLAKEPGIRIGRTILRVHDAAHPVPAEKLLTPPRAHARGPRGSASRCSSCCWCCSGSASPPSPARTRCCCRSWASSRCSRSGRASGRCSRASSSARRASRCSCASPVTACIALVLWDQLTESASFSLAWRDMAEYAGLGAWAVLGAACYGHLHAIGPRHMRAAMGLVVALIAAGALLQYFGKSETRKLLGPARDAGRPAPAGFPPAAARERRRLLQEGRGHQDEGGPGAREGADARRPAGRLRLFRLAAR